MASWSGKTRTTTTPSTPHPRGVFEALHTPPTLDIEKLAGRVSIRKVIEGYSQPKPEIQIKK